MQHFFRLNPAPDGHHFSSFLVFFSGGLSSYPAQRWSLPPQKQLLLFLTHCSFFLHHFCFWCFPAPPTTFRRTRRPAWERIQVSYRVPTGRVGQVMPLRTLGTLGMPLGLRILGRSLGRDLPEMCGSLLLVLVLAEVKCEIILMHVTFPFTQYVADAM